MALRDVYMEQRTHSFRAMKGDAFIPVFSCASWPLVNPWRYLNLRTYSLKFGLSNLEIVQGPHVFKESGIMLGKTQAITWRNKRPWTFIGWRSSGTARKAVANLNLWTPSCKGSGFYLG